MNKEASDFKSFFGCFLLNLKNHSVQNICKHLTSSFSLTNYILRVYYIRNK